jgi:hypothetical protein
LAEEHQHSQPDECGCLAAPQKFLVTERELGMDERYGEVSVLVCRACGRRWLRYFYEVEAFTASGRWFLGALTPHQAGSLTAENASSILEGLKWYWYGGSYFAGRTGRGTGKIPLNP